MSAFQAVRVRDHAKHGFLLKGRDGARNESAGSDFAGHGTGVAKNTIVRLLEELGCACADYHNRTIRNLKVRRLQCDEIWEFVGAKQRTLLPKRRLRDSIRSATRKSLDAHGETPCAFTLLSVRFVSRWDSSQSAESRGNRVSPPESGQAGHDHTVRSDSQAALPAATALARICPAQVTTLF